MLYSLHGFLGRPDDFPGRGVDLFAEPILPFWKWAENFNKNILKKSTLLGYSMGGRLALHALIQNPALWESATIISAFPGQAETLSYDPYWENRFLNDPWDDLMRDWNAQPVFKHDPPVIRCESDYSRKKLAQALKTWSHANQEDLRSRIEALPMPIHWIVGEKDIKYTALASQLKFVHQDSRLTILKDTGHRISLSHSKKNGSA